MPAYEWQSHWQDPVESDAPDEYKQQVRRMIMASIDWLAAHPAAEAKWRELDLKALVRDQGLGPDVEIIAVWSDVFQPLNAHARHWFRAIVQAGSQGKPDLEPTSRMMTKAVYCGQLFKSTGWAEFDRFMTTFDKTVH